MMVSLLLATQALAGPPYQACTESEGQLAFVSPGDGRVFQLDGRAPKVLGTVPRTGARYQTVIAPAPGGGFYVGAESFQLLAADGSVSPVDKPEPQPMFDALRKKQAAFSRGGAMVSYDKDDLGGTVYRTEADGAQSRLWTFDNWSKAPLGLFVQGDTVYAVTSTGVEIHPAEGDPQTLPYVGSDLVGACATSDGTLYAVSMKGREALACVHLWSGSAWSDLFCLE